jgi:hypothetical protein
MIGALRMRVLVEWFGGGIGYEASAGRVNAAHPIVVLVRMIIAIYGRKAGRLSRSANYSVECRFAKAKRGRVQSAIGHAFYYGVESFSD